jgi:integrase
MAVKWIKATRRGRAVPGVFVRHQAACAMHVGGAKCSCQPSYRAQVWDAARQRPAKSPSYPGLSEAEGWLVDFRRSGRQPAEGGALTATTFRDLAEQILADIEAGNIGTRRTRAAFSGRTLASYRSTLRLHVYPHYGAAPVAELTITDWQRLIDRLAREGKATNTINNVLNPVRTVYRWACSPARGTERLQVNPTVGLELPARNEKKRDRIAAPAEAAQLLEALPLEDRVPFALAMYAGLRRKEIAHLTWDGVSFPDGVIRVSVTKGETAGVRSVPLVEPLRKLLAEWLLKCPIGYPISAPRPVCPPRKTSDSGLMSFDMLLKRARKDWEIAGLEPIGLHEGRHTFASYLIAAGVNAKAVTTYMGHSSVDITFDRYGHLFPGNEDQAAGLVNDYLRRAAQ